MGKCIDRVMDKTVHLSLIIAAQAFPLPMARVRLPFGT